MSLHKGNIINNRYIIDKKVGHGSFGDVYIGFDRVNKHLIAVKIENNGKNILRHEYQIYQDLASSLRPPLIPTVYWYGTVGGSGGSRGSARGVVGTVGGGGGVGVGAGAVGVGVGGAGVGSGSSKSSKSSGARVMVMKYLGNSLDHLLHICGGGVFTLHTTLMVGLQIFDALMLLHGCGYVHRDIKPDNFLMGIGPDKAKLYLIDFGLAKRYKSVDRVHIRRTEGKNLIGTARYASINSHIGIELSRRDDMESLGYMLIYFLKGKLPWQGIPADNRDQKYKKIGEAKARIQLEELCRGIPVELYEFMTHVRSLKFKEKPNYTYLRSLIINCFNRMGYQYNSLFDWDKGPHQIYRIPDAGAPI